MKPLRRLETPSPAGPYAKAQRGVLRYLSLSEEEFRALHVERPGLVVVEGEAVLIGWPASGAINLQYGYPGHSAFAQQFPKMLERLLVAVVANEAPIGVCLRLTERSARAYVEPVLISNAFELVREWWQMTLDELPDAPIPGDELAGGFVLRPARPDDAEAIAKLDAVSFVTASLTPSVAREQIERAPVLRVLEDPTSGRGIGYLQLGVHAPAGYVSELVVDPAYHRRGLGEAMLRWGLAWFRSRDITGASLTVNTDNAPAIALYRKLGFVAGEVGVDYRRPVDEDEVRQVLEKRLGAHIRVRRR